MEEPVLQHFSHAHALQLFAVQYHGEAVCAACNKPCPGETAYRCATCNFFLDRTCVRTPQAIRHPGHPDHTLALRAAPTFADGSFSCDACRGRVTAFSFCCTACEFVLHISCANAPLQQRHHSHQHPLALVFSCPYDGSSFACDVCRQVGAEDSWLYRCAPCGFDAHIGCATSPAPPQGHYHHRQQQQQPPEQRVPFGTFQSQQPSHQPPVKSPARAETQPAAVDDDAVAIQMLALGMQQAQILNQMNNNIFQTHMIQQLSRPFVSSWQVDGFMSAPTVPQPTAYVGMLSSALMTNMTNNMLDAGIALAGAAATPALGTNPLLGQVALGQAGFSGQPASNAADDFLANFLKGNDSSGTANPQWDPLSGSPEEFLDNLIKNADWIPQGYRGY